MLTLLTPAPPFRGHNQMTVAADAAMSQQYNLIIKHTGFAEKLVHPFSHLKGSLNDVHSSGSTCSAGFWCLGVNFLPQSLHSRNFRTPIVLVMRAPFF